MSKGRCGPKQSLLLTFGVPGSCTVGLDGEKSSRHCDQCFCGPHICDAPDILEGVYLLGIRRSHGGGSKALGAIKELSEEDDEGDRFEGLLNEQL